MCPRWCRSSDTINMKVCFADLNSPRYRRGDSNKRGLCLRLAGRVSSRECTVGDDSGAEGVAPSGGEGLPPREVRNPVLRVKRFRVFPLRYHHAAYVESKKSLLKQGGFEAVWHRRLRCPEKDRCRKAWTAGDWLSLQARIESQDSAPTGCASLLGYMEVIQDDAD